MWMGIDAAERHFPFARYRHRSTGSRAIAKIDRAITTIVVTARTNTVAGPLDELELLIHHVSSRTIDFTAVIGEACRPRWLSSSIRLSPRHGAPSEGQTRDVP